MTTVFKYICAWLFLPILAIRHKLKRVTHYEIQCANGFTSEYPDYIVAQITIEAILEFGGYGDYIKLVEFRANGEHETVINVEW